MNNPLVWKNLSINKCPRCNKDLRWDEAGNLYCTDSFIISQIRFRQIVSSQITREIEDALNEMYTQGG